MKLLLDYEEVALHLQYNAKKEFFSSSTYPPNSDCKDKYCIQRQKEKIEKLGFLKERKDRHEQKAKEAIKPVEHNKEEVDKWGIELVEDEKKTKESTVTHTISKAETEGQNLDDLMNQLKNM